MGKLIILREGEDLPLVGFDIDNCFFLISGNIFGTNDEVDLFFKNFTVG